MTDKHYRTEKRSRRELYLEDTCAFQLWVLRLQKLMNLKKANKKKNQR